MGLMLITPPTEEPITLQEAKNHLRVDTNDDDMLITALIRAAREHAEAITRRSFITQIWEMSLDNWPEGMELIIPFPPLQSVISVKYLDSAGIEHIFDADKYIVDTLNEPGRIVLKNYNYCWPTDILQPADSIYIQFKAGYGTAAEVPQSIKQAMLLMIGHWYENREATISESIQLPLAVEALLWPYRILRWL